MGGRSASTMRSASEVFRRALETLRCWARWARLLWQAAEAAERDRVRCLCRLGTEVGRAALSAAPPLFPNPNDPRFRGLDSEPGIAWRCPDSLSPARVPVTDDPRQNLAHLRGLDRDAMRRRGEMVEEFANVLDGSGMHRAGPRCRENDHKRYLIESRASIWAFPCARGSDMARQAARKPGEHGSIRHSGRPPGSPSRPSQPLE